MILALGLTAVLESNAIEEAVVAAREHGKAIAGGGNEHSGAARPGARVRSVLDSVRRRRR